MGKGVQPSMARWPAAEGGPGQLVSGKDSGQGSSHWAHGRSDGAVADGRRLGRGGGRLNQAAARSSQGQWPAGRRGGRVSRTQGGGDPRRRRWPRRQGPEELVARDVNGGPTEDDGPKARTTIGRWQDAGGQEQRRRIWGRRARCAQI
jgi:hypothetical protein